jgi:hypothetical protein
MRNEIEMLAEEMLALLYARTPTDERDEVHAMADRLYAILRPAPVRGAANPTGYSLWVRDCLVCHEEFSTTSGSRRMCSDACARKRRADQTNSYRAARAA